MRIRTEYDKKYDKERYKWLKEHHICVRCKKEKAEEGKLFCLICKIDKREQEKNRVIIEDQKQKNRVHKKRRYDILVAFGICPTCGVRIHKNGSIFCSKCGIKRNLQAKNKRIENGGTARELFGTAGICSVCGKPTVDSSKQCNRCLENSRRTIKIAQQKSLEAENNWRNFSI